MSNQKYKIALCKVQFKDKTEIVLRAICLEPMEELGIKEGDNLDNKVFFYCKDYEEFLGLFNEDNGEDFVIRGILSIDNID